MLNETWPNSTSRTLRIAMVAEFVFLAVAGLLLFTEHRAHYLGALPYGLAIAGITACLWLRLEVRKHLQDLNLPPGPSGGNPEKGGNYHEP